MQINKNAVGADAILLRPLKTSWFAAERLTGSSWYQKTFDRSLLWLSNGFWLIDIDPEMSEIFNCKDQHF